MTNCLVENTTGIEFDTDFCMVTKTIMKSDAIALMEDGWKFDWSIPHRNGYEIYQLFVEGEEDVQGMIALKHIRDQLFTQVDIVEAAPFNVGKDGRYSGVGAHLFAIACKLSWDAGNEGYVQFTAKTNLIEHYQQTLGAHLLGRQNMYIDTYGAIKLINKYFKEGLS
jgi:hypothetical protein